MYITRAELEDCFKGVGMTLASDQSEAIMIDHSCLETDYLCVEDLYAKLTCWRETSAAVEPVRETTAPKVDDAKLQSDLEKLRKKASSEAPSQSQS